MVVLLLVAHAVEHGPNRKGDAEGAQIVTNTIGSLVFAMQLVELRKRVEWPTMTTAAWGALPHETLSSMHLSQRRTFVHRDVIGLIALDFILRIIRAGVMSVSLVIGVSCMDLDDPAADMTGFGVPRHVIANLEFRGHDGCPQLPQFY
jgi:hypothetical protein